MRVLVVARCKEGKFAPFIAEQVEAVRKRGIDCQLYGITGKGIAGYIRQLPDYLKVIRVFHPDLIHAHYGLSGVFANLQRKVPVVTTYHGSDINDAQVFRLSRIAIRWSRFNIFVSRKTMEIARPKKDFALIPCGVNLDDFPFLSRTEARIQLGLDLDKKYVLFAGAFDNPVKNASLAKASVALVPEVEFLELKGYSRSQVVCLMQAVDTLLLTSLTEGSPQVVKEALAGGCPVVSVDVGDVRERVSGIDGCYITQADPSSVADCLRQALAFEGKTRGREAIVRDGLTNDQVAVKLKGIYEEICLR